MAALRLFGELRAQGIGCRVEGGQVLLEAPRQSLTAAHRARVLAVKGELVRLLSETCSCCQCMTLGEKRRVLRLHCASGLDADPEWEALRRELDAMDDAAERLAIQEEGCS